LNFFLRHKASFGQHFKPVLRLVGFFNGDTNFGYKICF
jgi:hypothetical protein